MTEKVQNLVRKLAREGEKCVEFFGTLPGIWDAQIYSDGGMWKVRQVLVHIVQIEDYYLRLLKGLLDGEDILGADFDLDAFNQDRVAELEGHGPERLLDLFRQRRQATCRWLESNLTEDDLSLVGRHPIIGDSSLENLVKMIYLHIQSHLRDIQRLIRAQSNA
jgi:uncharacterized damage-inducible protein DinB